jgi:hypothetical protein
MAHLHLPSKRILGALAAPLMMAAVLAASRAGRGLRVGLPKLDRRAATKPQHHFQFPPGRERDLCVRRLGGRL